MRRRKPPDPEALMNEAIVDAYDEDEQIVGLFTMIQDNLKLPFETEILGVPVEVQKVELRGERDIVAVCARGRRRQRIPILDLPLPDPTPKGAHWIEAYRFWCGPL